MSLKENMEAIKEELNSEEKFFESAIRTERFVKRYQKPLIAAFVGVILAFAGSIGYQAYTDSKNESANLALNKLLVNPGDKDSEARLKKDNPKLYDLWKLSLSIHSNDLESLKGLKNSSASEVADIATYESAVSTGDINTLNSYSKKQGALYKEIALLELALHALEQGDSVLAHQTLALISKDSPVYQLGQSLQHYGAK